jgi:transcription factor CRZ1
MDSQRGRSPSTGPHIRQSHSPSPHPPFNSNLSGLGLQQPLSPPDPTFDTTAPTTTTTTTGAFDINQQYLTADHNSQFQQRDNTFLHTQGGDRAPSPSFGQEQSNNLFAQGNDGNNTINPAFLNEVGDSNSFLDPALLDESLMNQMATTQAHSPTPPHLLVQPDMHRASSASPHHSPNMNQGGFPSPGQHSRHASLDPASAAFPQGQNNEWSNMYRGHRRTPSDAYSDVSSSAHPSPYLGNTEQFNDNPSPLLQAQQDPAMFQDVMTFGQFSLNESSSQHASPAHSPHISPRLLPTQQPLPQFTAENNFGLNNQFNQGGLGVYPNPPSETFPSLHNNSVDMGQADQMSPPEINIDFAPPSRQPSFGPGPKSENGENALSPPDRCKNNRFDHVSVPF